MKTPNPKTTKSKSKPKRKPREWIGWARAWEDGDLTGFERRQHFSHSECPGTQIIKVKVSEVIE